MNQRKPGDPLRIVCTDRGRHAQAQLAEYWRAVDGSGHLTNRGLTISVLSPDQHEPAGPLSSVSYESVAIKCVRCGRNPKGWDLFSRMFGPVYDSGLLDRLDISRLDM